MQTNRRKFLLGSATVGATALTGCSGVETDDSTDSPTPEPLDWTGRYVNEKNLAWASRRNLTDQQFSDWFETYKDQGYIIVDVDARTYDGTTRYAMVWRENVDDREWAEWRNLTSQEYHDRWEQYRDDGYRPLTIEGYLKDDSDLRFAGIWVENEEDLGWHNQRNLTSDEFLDYFEEQKSEGRRPVDLELYPTGSGVRISSLWYDNVDDVEWAHYYNMPRSEYQQRTEDYFDDGYRTIDYESYVVDGDRRYAAIWAKPDDDLAAQVRTNRSSIQFGNYWRDYLDQGFRLLDQEHYGTSNDLYGGIWVENADRYRYEHKEELTSIAEDYRDDQDLPGLSVAVIEDGKMVYRRGFGDADEDAGREAHGETVYNAASVSKVIGGTLATRLESVGELQDGTAVSLDMSEKASTYLSDAEVPGDVDKEVDDFPASHDYNVEDLFAHLGCIPHYDGISNGDMNDQHYETATEAAEKIWSQGLLDGCAVGDDRNYSTHALTIAGAVLEQVTGRRIARLIEEEISEPYGLDSTRAMFDDESLTPDSQRAMKGGSGDPEDYGDSSWKVLGGGIESSAVDLARFGWAVLDGRVVPESDLDDRLWYPVHEDCSSQLDGDFECNYGIAWDLTEYDFDGTDRFVAQHGGSWSGAGSHLGVVRDEGLVFGMMSNESGGSQNLDALMDDLAEEIMS